MPDVLALTRLLQLSSPALPVGAYSYSQGLEWAIECGWVTNEPSAAAWIEDVLHFSLLSLEVPLLNQLLQAWSARDFGRVRSLNELFFATRESRELYEETRQMGYSLVRLIDDLQMGEHDARQVLVQETEVAFPSAWSFAAVHMQIDARDALVGYAFSWLENQVMAALKAVPLGQLAGQRLMLRLSSALADQVEQAMALPRERWNNVTPGLAIASCRHETQYSRIFRS